MSKVLALTAVSEPVPRPYRQTSIDELFDVAVREAQHVQNLVELPIALYADQGGTVAAAGVMALLREVRCTMDAVNDELRAAVQELELREAGAAQDESPASRSADPTTLTLYSVWQLNYEGELDPIECIEHPMKQTVVSSLPKIRKHFPKACLVKTVRTVCADKEKDGER